MADWLIWAIFSFIGGYGWALWHDQAYVAAIKESAVKQIWHVQRERDAAEENAKRLERLLSQAIKDIKG
jgi:hypothetical protein